MSILRVELRRSPLLWWVPALLAIQGLVLFGRSTLWIGVWPEASAAAQLGSFFFGLILTAGSAWAAARIRRAESAELLAGARRDSAWRELQTILASLTYGILVLLAGFVAVVVASVPDAPAGFVWPSYFLLGLSMVLLCVGLGHTMGRLLPPITSSAVALGGWLLVNVILTDSSAGHDYFYVLTGPVELRVSPAALTTRLIAGIAVCALAIVVVPRAERPALRRRHDPRPARTAAALGVVAVASALVLVTVPLQVSRAAPARPSCTANGPTVRVCLWPDSAKYLPAVAKMAQRVQALGQDVLSVPRTFYQLGLRPPSQQTQDDFTTDFGRWSIASSIGTQIYNASSPEIICPNLTEQQQKKFFQAAFDVSDWLSAYVYGRPRPSAVNGGPPGVNQAAITSLLGKPVAEQKAWAKTRLATQTTLCP